MKIVLASSSPYRKKLLQTLFPSVLCISPKIDESSHLDESPIDYVKRLSTEKAKKVACYFDDALVIGSDQCAVLNKKIITKPKNHEEAFKQLSLSSGHQVIFYTGLCLYNTNKKNYRISCETYKVKLRSLTDKQIESYLQKDKPYDCAGSFKAECLGIALFEELRGHDPNILLGLPMIKLITMLCEEGIDVLTYSDH